MGGNKVQGRWMKGETLRVSSRLGRSILPTEPMVQQMDRHSGRVVSGFSTRSKASHLLPLSSDEGGVGKIVPLQQHGSEMSSAALLGHQGVGHRDEWYSSKQVFGR